MTGPVLQCLLPIFIRILVTFIGKVSSSSFVLFGEIALYTAQAKREKIIEYGEGYFVRLTMQFALLGTRCMFWQIK